MDETVLQRMLGSFMQLARYPREFVFTGPRARHIKVQKKRNTVIENSIFEIYI